jgi:imidazolonepropionase-like amidohydrolase
MLDVQVAQVEQLVRAGVRIVAGTDAGWRSVPFGSLAVELSLLCQAGMSAGDAIVAATSRAAEAARPGEQVGVLAPGYRADIIAVDRDPLADIGVLEHPTMVLRDGQVVVRPSPRRRADA